MKVIIQIADKYGRRLERHTLNENGISTLRIGRGWDNDVILQDKFVDEAHLSIAVDQSGCLQISDLETTNGSSVAGKRLTMVDQHYHFGDVIRLGDSTIKLFDCSVAVEKARARSIWFALKERFSSLPMLALLTFLGVGFTLLESYAFHRSPYQLPDAFVTASQVLLTLLVWSVAFGLISKLVRGEGNIKAHWALACCALIAVLLSSVVVNIVRFNMQSHSIGQGVWSAIFAVLMLAFVFAVLTYATNFRSSMKWAWSLLCVVGVMFWGYADSFLKEEHELWSSASNTENISFPPALMLRSPITVEQYMNDTNALFDSLDKSLNISSTQSD